MKAAAPTGPIGSVVVPFPTDTVDALHGPADLKSGPARLPRTYEVKRNGREWACILREGSRTKGVTHRPSEAQAQAVGDRWTVTG